MCEKCMTIHDAQVNHGNPAEFHTKAFNYEQAKSGAPISTAFGTKVKVLTFERQGLKGALSPILIEDVTGATLVYSADGCPTGKDCWAQHQSIWRLVMRPIGYCEGLPVYVDDTLISPDDISWTAGCSADRVEFLEMLAESHWPQKYPKSLMTFDELNANAGTAATWEPRARKLADAAIEHAIRSGQVVAVKP